MDAQGIDMEALSINPIWYSLDRERATQVIRIQNEKLAEVCAAHPERFVAFASLALQFPDLAVQQLDDAIKKLNLRGAAIGGSVADAEFANAKFHPVWAKAEELGVLLFIHPAGVPALNSSLKGNGVLENVIGNPLDTTIALSQLIFQGTLYRFPGLKVCAAHGGGYQPSYADRSDRGCLTFPERCDPNIKLKKKPTEYLKQLYFDSLIFTPMPCATWRDRWVPATSSWGRTIRSRGKTKRWITSSIRRDSPTMRRSRCSGAPRRTC
jgi:aminocarboxymuconate-semialdehyde decarboxylase